jgi:hypothetical protein
MSTIFGVKLRHGDYIEVAKREATLEGSRMSWIDDWGKSFPRAIEVTALDNNPDGIYTIGDIIDTIEGQEKVERLRKQYVISEDELRIAKEQQLLKKLYQCQDDMEVLLDKGKEDIHYELMGILIKRLEDHLSNNLDLY